LVVGCILTYMNTSTLESALSSIVDDVVIEKVSYEESDPALDLFDAGEIEKRDDVTTDYYTVSLFTDDVAIGSLVVAEIVEVDVGYISDLEITPAYLNQGLGSEIVQAIVSMFEKDSVERVFIVPSSDSMTRIVEKSGFTEVKWDLEDWFVKNV